MKTREFLQQVSNGFSAGNYANAYGTECLETALAALDESDENYSQNYRDAFIVGFFSSYEVWEIPADSLEAFQEAYHSNAGQECVGAGYCDDRPREEWQRVGY